MKLAYKWRPAFQTGGGFVNEFPSSQPKKQVQSCINVEQVEGFEGIDYLKQISKNQGSCSQTFLENS